MRNNILLFMYGLSLPIAVHAETTVDSVSERPNILCIVCEDISPYLGCYGDSVAVTPYLDEFAAESIRYTGMYTTMGVSAPSRAALITGMYPSAIGANNMRTSQKKSKPVGITPYDVVLPEGVKCYTEYLRAAGYYCTNNSKTDYQFEVPLTAWDEQGIDAHWRNTPENMPFFSIFNINVSHEFQVMHRSHLPLTVAPNDIVVPPYFPDDPIIRNDMAVMYSNNTEMDKQFKSLFDELKEDGRLENTIVIFYSDNGGPLPRQKREIYESGTLVPFMVRFPDSYRAGETDNDLHMFVDIPATVLSLAGVDIPDYMHGQAFLGDQKSSPRKYIFGARDRVDTFFEKQGAVRDAKYRYIRNYMPEQSAYLPIISRSPMPMMQRMVELYEAGRLNAEQSKWFVSPRPKMEFYDVINDPHELYNLADDPSLVHKISELSDVLDTWINDYNPEWHLTEFELIDKFRPDGKQPVVSQPDVNVVDGVATITCDTPGSSIAYQINGKGFNENHWFLYTEPFIVDSADVITAIGVRAGYRSSTVQAYAEELLMEWVEALISYQLEHPDPLLDGGILCPACSRIHGRIGDAVLPLLYAAEKTSNPKYIKSAQRLMHWMDNVFLNDGSWKNDINVSDWNGTTVFGAISLYESLNNYGYLLDDSTKAVWEERLLSAGEFIYNNDFIYSRRRDGMRNMNVNYSASATYALYSIGSMFGNESFMEKATVIASDLKDFFTETDYFLFGEGPEIWEKTKNGCLPVDLGYNVEESLPNMIQYALMAGDEKLYSIVEKSMKTHLEFMLPDGGWDNSWGTRSFKWTYWGGRTSDGFMPGYALGDVYKNPEFYEAIRENITLLKKATHDGLLYGGMHYRVFEMPACIHHTFGHAKALASFLTLPVSTPERVQLPRDKEYGVKYFKDIHTWLVSEGGWRATVTGFDAEYKVKGTHPMGGALSLLWHKDAGPLFAATMNEYTMIESPNMQSYDMEVQMGGTPRVEFIEKGISYSNLDDLDTDIIYSSIDGKHLFKIRTHLVDTYQRHSSLGEQPVEVLYTIDNNSVSIDLDLPEKFRERGIRLVLPLVSNPKEGIELDDKRLIVKKDDCNLVFDANCSLTIDDTEQNGRVFNPVPGFGFLPIVATTNGEKSLKVVMRIINN